MTDRIHQFLPSILIIGSISVFTYIYLKVAIKRIGPSWKSIEWHSQNKWKVTWLIGTPVCNVWAPTAEELVFRAPLIIAFGALSPSAWIGILASSVVFGAVHWFGKKINILEILSKKESGGIKSDDFEAEVAKIEASEAKRIHVQRILHVLTTILLGILSGYYGIKYQSIWVSVGIHSLWNFVMPIIFALIIAIVLFSGLGVLTLRDKLRLSRG